MEKLKILVVDDESRMRKLVKDFLVKAGYDVIEAGDGEQAVDTFYAQKDIALIILDVMMPKMDGWQVYREIRQNSKVPIIMLTAKSEERDELLGFDLGVDEYISKPFSPKILVARVEAILRRSSGGKKRQLKVADLVYDLDTLDITRADQPLKLNPLTMKLLAILMQKSPAVVRREALEEALWGDDSPDSDSLRSHIHQLRQVIDKPFATPLLHTLHGVGYRLADKDNDL